MGVKDTEWAYSLELLASPKAVLLALAFCRNGQTGRCFPSQQELMKMTGLSLATVKRSLGDLDTDAIITRTKTSKGAYRSNDEYQFNHDFDPAKAQLTMTAAHHEPRSPRAKVELTEFKSGAHHERAVEPTGIEPEDNRKRAPERGTRIPKDFTVTPEMVSWARERTPLVDGLLATEKFRNHWTAATRNATKLDWPATWRNWMLRDQEYAERAPQRRVTPDERAAATMRLATDFTPMEIAS